MRTKLKVEDIEHSTIEELVEEMDYQMLLLNMRTSDNVLINMLAKEFKERDRQDLIKKYQPILLKAYFNVKL